MFVTDGGNHIFRKPHEFIRILMMYSIPKMRLNINERRKGVMNISLTKPGGMWGNRYTLVQCVHQLLEGRLGRAGPWRLTTFPGDNPLVAGLLGGPGRSQRTGQGGREHSTWKEVAG